MIETSGLLMSAVGDLSRARRTQLIEIPSSTTNQLGPDIEVACKNTCLVCDYVASSAPLTRARSRRSLCSPQVSP